MTQYIVNKSGLDEVSLEINQTGNPESSINLKVPLLDDKKSYVFCVDNLIVPLDEAPLFKYDVGDVLFTIERRNAGSQFSDLFGLVGAAAHVHLGCGTLTVDAAGIVTVTDGFGVYAIERNVYDVPSLVADLNNFARGFEIKQSLKGINLDINLYGAHVNVDLDVDDITPLNQLEALTEAAIREFGTYPLLDFRLLNDGTLVIQGSSDFWGNFIINFTPAGMETLGFTPFTQPIYNAGQISNVLSVTRLADGTITHNQYGQLLDGTNVSGLLRYDGGETVFISEANMNSDYPIYSQHSLFQCADQRLKIVVESHLPTLSNVSIVNSKESVDRSICEFFFEKSITASTIFDRDGRYESSKMTTNIYSGEVSLIKKSNPYKTWTKLQTSYEQRFFRFHLYIFYRKYNSVTTKWDITKELLGIPKDMYWSMLLRFVSET